MQLYVIRRPSAWANLAELEKAGAKSARIGNEDMPDRVRWIRSYVVNEPDGRIGTSASMKRRMANPSANMPAASACRATNSIPSPQLSWCAPILRLRRQPEAAAPEAAQRPIGRLRCDTFISR